MIEHPRYYRPGFTLLELVMCLSLIALVLTLANELLHSSFINIMQLSRLHAGTARIDHCLAALRRDTWESQSADSTDPAEISLRMDASSNIIWTASESTLTRKHKTSSGEIDTQRWTLPFSMQFAASASGMTVIVRDKSTEQRIAMIRPLAFMEARP